MKEHTPQIIKNIHNTIINQNQMLDNPYNPQHMTYTDYTTSNQNLTFIEKYIHEKVIPHYANTHTKTSKTNLQTTHFQKDTQTIIHNTIKTNEQNIIIFNNSKTTKTINHLINMLNIQLPTNLNKKYSLNNHIPTKEHPIIFIKPYEHHSNKIP